MGRRLFWLSVGLSLAVGLAAGTSQRSWSAFFWLASLAPPLLLARRASARPPTRLRGARFLALVGAALLPVAVRVANLDATRLHGDEYLEAYFADTQDFRHQSFFTLMPERGEWIARFPQPHFLIQRLFFEASGANPRTLQIRLSVQLYSAAVGVTLFLIAEELSGAAAGWIAVVLYAFFAPSAYLETIGVHFVSATAALCWFFHRALRLRRRGELFDAALAGLACGLCYLTYYSSYLAFPLLAAFTGIGLLRGAGRRALTGFSAATGMVLAVVAPFAANLVTLQNSLTYRARQISLLTGHWSPHREAIAQGRESPAAVVWDNLVLCLRSAVRDGLGGQGGYEYGRLAFFDGLTLVFFLAGAVFCLAAWRRRPELLLVLGVVAAAFFGYVVLTIAPPAWHRLSVAFPFVALVMALPLAALARMRAPAALRVAVPCGILLLYAIRNECRLTEALVRDAPPPELPLLQVLKQRFGDRTVTIAGDRMAHLQKVFHFWDVPRAWDAPPVAQRVWLKSFRSGTRYVCVVNESFIYRAAFQKADPAGRFYAVTPYYGVFAN